LKEKNYFYFKDTISPNNGVLDVDKNKEGTMLSANAIENIFYKKTPPTGTYQVNVINYKKNSSINVIPAILQIKAGSFNQEIPIEINNNGSQTQKKVHSFNYPITE
jgi:hypothetical protein